jgi:hypothetical protein
MAKKQGVFMETEIIIFCGIDKSKSIVETLKDVEKGKYSYSVFENRISIKVSPISKFSKMDFREISSGSEMVSMTWMDLETWLYMNDGFNNVSISGIFEIDRFYDVASLLRFDESFRRKLKDMENPSCPISSEDFISSKEMSIENFFSTIPNKVETDEVW